MARGDFIEPSELTFYEFLRDEFLPHIKIDAKPGSYQDYLSITENHIKNDPLGRTIITDITARYVEAYKRRKLDGPRLDGRPGGLSPKTVKNHIILIKAAFNYACLLGMFKYNPVQYASFPKVSKYKPIVFTEEEAVQFIQTAADDPYYLFFLLAIYTGLREGELRGLTWPAVDLENCRISVMQTVRGEGKKAIYGEPKTEESIGAVTFDPTFIPLFEHQRRKQMEDMEKCRRLGIVYNNRHLVFATYTGNPVGRRIIIKHFNQIIEAAGVRKIRFHDLRHSCATLLISKGVPLKVVQERLRHADIRTTGNIYSHVLPRMQEEANEKMGKILKLSKPEKERQKEREKKKATQ